MKGGTLKIQRWIDHWVGLPLCFCCSLFIVIKRAIFPPRQRVFSGKGSIVIFKFFGLGSVIQATVLIQSLKQHFPDSTIKIVTFPENKLLCERLELFDDIRVIRKSFFLFIYDVLKLILSFWLKKVDVIIDLEFFSKFSTLLSLASFAPIRIGFHLNDFWRYNIITHPIYFNYFKHIAEIYQQAGLILGISDFSNSLKSIKTTSDESASYIDKLYKHKWDSSAETIAMNVNAGALCLERRWPLNCWSDLIEQFVSSAEKRCVLLTGSPGERHYVEELIAILPEKVRSKTINMAGVWSIPEFTLGLTLCECFITNDSGPMHLAAATAETPIIAIWGPQQPTIYSPKVSHITNLYCNFPCSPCIHMPTCFEGMWCNHRGDCMKQIKPDAVIQKLELILQNESNQS